MTFGDLPTSPVSWEAWEASMHATLLFVIRDGKILLIEKKRGLGAGKINGPGGKMERGETPMECAVRETWEELQIVVKDPRKVGELRFSMSDIPDILCHVFVATKYSGRPVETAEANPRWVAIEDIPYERMWADDRHWVPLMLEDRGFRGFFVFSGESVVWSHVMTDIDWSTEN